MNYKTRKSFKTSKIWLIITIFVFAISYILTQIMYTSAKEKPEIDIKLLVVSFITPIILCTISLALSHFQKYRLGAIFGIFVGINLISNVAFTKIIISSSEALITLFEPIFSLLPLLNNSVGVQQFEFIELIMGIIQVIYGIFLIGINLPILFKNDRSVFNDI